MFHIKDAFKASALTCAESSLFYRNLLKFKSNTSIYFIATKCIWKCHLPHHERLYKYKPQWVNQCYATITTSIGFIQNIRHQFIGLFSWVSQNPGIYATNTSVPTTHILSYADVQSRLFLIHIRPWNTGVYIPERYFVFNIRSILRFVLSDVYTMVSFDTNIKVIKSRVT